MIHHRHGAVLLIALLSCIATVRGADSASEKNPEKKWNVLFITVDDMNWDSVGAFGCPVQDITPNIDKLASQGLRFEYAHVTIAICQPTRAVWMTGRYPHRNGALGFDPIRRGVPTLLEKVKSAGYFTGIMAKVGHVVPTRRAAWDVIVQAAELKTGRDPKLYYARSKEFFEKASRSGRPFFLMANSQDPHRPFAGSRQEQQRRAPRKKQRRKKGAKKTQKNSGKKETVDKKAEKQAAGKKTARAAGSNQKKKRNTKKKNRRRGGFPGVSRTYTAKEVPVPGFLPDLPAVRKEIAEYYTSVHRADEIVGSVLKALDESGMASRTIVMFKSDHGMPLPFAKTNCWYHSTRTPWIVRWPGVVQPGSHDTQHFVSGIDFAPTILDALGLQPLQGMDGRSFLPLLKGGEEAGRGHAITHINRTAGKREFPMRAVQTARYSYIFNGWADGRTRFRNESQNGLTMRAMIRAAETDKKVAQRVKHFLYRTPEEFYDNQNDPDARHNLIDDPQHAKIIAQLRLKLLEHMKATGDPQLAAYRLLLSGAKR